MTDTAGSRPPRRRACLFSLGMLSIYGVGFMMFLIAFLLSSAAFAVTQIASETKGLALDVIAPPTR